VTYNVRGFRDGMGRVLGVVSALRPDVLLLQETGSRRSLRRFAAGASMRAVADPWSPGRRRVRNAVLLANPWEPSSIALARFAGSRRWYPRGALAVRATVDAGPSLWMVSTHLGLDGSERGQQADALIRSTAGFGQTPAVIGGDLNATPDMRAPARIAAHFPDAWISVERGDGFTFPASRPEARIDYVFVSGSITVEGASVGGEGSADASDHLPVCVDIAFATDPATTAWRGDPEPDS
jgi:endonuclease/exonuclease/phosphatase family metal-dependent hydrolase